MKLFTIGFTKRSAPEFFGAIREAGVARIVDVRLNNVSQLAGFAKRDDLAYFAREICGAEYAHVTSLAPTSELLDAYRKGGLSWDDYEAGFLRLMADRRVEAAAVDLLRDGDCLLCSEPTAHKCHRKLVLEYLQSRGLDIEIQHL